MRYRSNGHLQILLAGFTIRLFGVIVTTVTTLNPDSTTDAVRFAATARSIATGTTNVQLIPLLTGQIGIYEFWGSILAPFWLLPGPSGLYARVLNALLATLAIYNIYTITRFYHSHHAGVVASLPVVFFPSFIAVQTTILREALVLAGMTTAARLLILPHQKHRTATYVASFVLLYITTLLRVENVIIYAAAIIAAVIAYGVETERISMRTTLFGISLVPLFTVVFLPVINRGIEYLGRTRMLRAFGRTAYLPSIIPDTLLEFIAFSWVAAAYFLYAPFPWMIETIPDLLVGVEGLINILFTIAAILGIRHVGQKDQSVAVGLVVGLSIALVLYGAGTANYGTAVRHRQMFTWLIYVFGGIGLSERIRIVWPFPSNGRV